MLDLATVNVEGASEGIKIAGSIVDAIESKFPGIALFFDDKAQVAHGKRMMSAVNALRQHGAGIGLDADVVNALVGQVLRNMGADKRVAACVANALPAIDNPDDINSLDDGLADYWRMHAEKASTEDMQQLLGALLAGEINKPGVVSKRTLSIVADMNDDDARVFQKLCAVSLGGYIEELDWELPPQLMITNQLGVYCDGYVTLRELNDMESLGLVKTNVSYIPKISEGLPIVIGDDAVIVCDVEDGVKISYSQAVFTKYGTELASMFKLGTHPNLREWFACELEAQNVTLKAFSLDEWEKLNRADEAKGIRQ